MRGLQNVISVVFLIYSINAIPQKNDGRTVISHFGRQEGLVFPLLNVTGTMNPEEMGPGSDILFDEEDDDAHSRTGYKLLSRRWPNATIPYVIADSYNSQQRDLIMRAMNDIQSESCVRFVPRVDEKAYIDILNTNRCRSAIGHFGHRQTVYLEAPICFTLRTVLHELLHTLGFIHEHSRPDRNEYITVYDANIKSGQEGDFAKLHKSLINDFGVPYDYNSVMHFSEYAASVNGEKTIVPTGVSCPGRMGHGQKLSECDIAKINLMYNCPDDSSDSPNA